LEANQKGLALIASQGEHLAPVPPLVNAAHHVVFRDDWRLADGARINGGCNLRPFVGDFTTHFFVLAQAWRGSKPSNGLPQ
jgi:hypothetical protein